MKIARLSVLCAVVMLAGALDAFGKEAIRKAVGAGPLYPEKREALVDSLYRMYANAPKRPAGMKLAACVVPYSAYGLAGKVMAAALSQMEPGDYKRVVVLGASTATTFQGCSIPAVEAFQTPLGYVKLDQKAIEIMARSNLFSMRSVRYRASEQHPPLHEIETSIEVVLPFLQERLGEFLLVPVVVGDLRDTEGKPNRAAYDNVARSVASICDEHTLLVVTAEFTHYGPEFKYIPFRDDIAKNIQTLDEDAFACVLERKFDTFQMYLSTTKNPIGGAEGLGVLMLMLSSQVQGTLLAYETSGKLLNNLNQSSSYAAFGFYVPSTPSAAAP